MAIGGGSVGASGTVPLSGTVETPTKETMISHANPQDRRAADPFDGVETWLFDLDNTLYPASAALMAQVTERMSLYIAELLALDVAAAAALRTQYFREYGTTLRGLMTCHAIDPEAYLDYVHDIDLSAVAADARLAAALARLPGRKIIFTNASTTHATRVLERLRLADHFECIFDIGCADYQPKPDRRTYERLLAAHAVDPARAVMVEDIARNLVPAAELGMTTVWLRSDVAWASEGAGDHIDVVIDDLAAWLESLVGGESEGPARR